MGGMSGIWHFDRICVMIKRRSIFALRLAVLILVGSTLMSPEGDRSAEAQPDKGMSQTKVKSRMYATILSIER